MSSSDLAAFYRTLELEPGATLDEVKQAYRDLAKIWHPDRFPNDERLKRKAEQRQQALNQAFQALRNVLERADDGHIMSAGAGTTGGQQADAVDPPVSRARTARDTWTVRPALGLHDVSLTSARRKRRTRTARLRVYLIVTIASALALVAAILAIVD